MSIQELCAALLVAKVPSSRLFNLECRQQQLGCRQRQHEAPHLVRIFILAKNREWRPASAELGGVARVVAVLGPRQASKPGLVAGLWQGQTSRFHALSPPTPSPHRRAATCKEEAQPLNWTGLANTPLPPRVLSPLPLPHPHPRSSTSHRDLVSPLSPRATFVFVSNAVPASS
jgi:hypothetical protein